MAEYEPDIAALRQGLEAFNRGEFDAAAMNLDENVVLVPAGGQPIEGREHVRAWMDPDAFASQCIEPLGFTVAGNKILIRQRVVARGAGSGIELDWKGWGVWTYSERGTVARIEVFLDHEEDAARAAAGLDVSA